MTSNAKSLKTFFKQRKNTKRHEKFYGKYDAFTQSKLFHEIFSYYYPPKSFFLKDFLKVNLQAIGIQVFARPIRLIRLIRLIRPILDGIEDFPNNLPFTIYNLRGLWTPVHPKSFRAFRYLKKNSSVTSFS